jgi:pentatricopeptide repeat protein
MKIAAAGLTTALLVFAVASVMSEMLLTPDVTHSSETATPRKTRSSKYASESVRSPRSSASSRRADIAAQDSVEQQTSELQRMLSEVRQRESEVQAKQDALRIIFDGIREEQQSVDLLRRQVSDEIAALRDASARLAQRESMISAGVASNTSLGRSADSQASTRPLISLRDSQAVRDTAVLVSRLARQGSVREAIALLRRMKDRDSTKVLTELSAIDLELAMRLSDDLVASRDETSSRR